MIALRSVRRRALLLALLAAAGTGASLADGDAKPRIANLAVEIAQDRPVVSYELTGALAEETLERIHSGIPVRFRHRLEVVAKRGFPLLPAREVARTVVETRVEYDSLTQRYQLLRTVQIRSHRKRLTPPPSEERLVTESRAEMAAWMTRLDRIPVYDPARPLPDGKLRVKVEVSLGRRYVLLIFPGTVRASAESALERSE